LIKKSFIPESFFDDIAEDDLADFIVDEEVVFLEKADFLRYLAVNKHEDL